MRKLTGLLIVLFLNITSFGAGINFVDNLTWAQIKTKAAKENKMIFFDAYATWCGPCKYLESSVYTDDAVADYYNTNYINVKFDMEEGEGINLAEAFGITSYPTLMYFSPSGQLVHKYIGAMDAPEFVTLGKDASDPAKQYFTLKAKALTLKLTDAEFQTWAEMADQMEDEDKDDIIAAFLASKKDILENEYTAGIALFYTDQLDDKQIAYLYSNKARMSKFPEWTAEKVSHGLYQKLFRRALRSYEMNNNNIDSFRFQFRKFDAARADYAEKDLNFRKEISGDNIKATSLLIQYLNDKKNPLGLDDIAGWLLDYSSYFEKANYTELNKVLKTFSFRPADKDKEFWLYLMQLVCEMNLGNEEATRAIAEKAFRHPKLPEEYRKILAESYNFK